MNKRTTKCETNIEMTMPPQGNSSVGQEHINYFYPKHQHRKPYTYFKFGN